MRLKVVLNVIWWLGSVATFGIVTLAQELSSTEVRSNFFRDTENFLTSIALSHSHVNAKEAMLATNLQCITEKHEGLQRGASIKMQ